jgi:hypothetical protein
MPAPDAVRDVAVLQPDARIVATRRTAAAATFR